MKKLLVLAAFALAGCTVPQVADVGTVTVPDQPTFVASPTISAQCRADLTAVGSDGVALLELTDARLDSAVAFVDPAAEESDAMSELATAALVLGVGSCGS